MAAASPVHWLQEEATCPICLEYYKDPVTIKCGHNFCRACITGCSDGRGTALPCPQCREICPQEDLRPNRQLQSMVEFVKQLSVSVQQERPPGEQGLCEEHEERLKLFCEEDETLICVICRESSDHKTHTVHPLKEAAQEYKRKLQDWQGTLRAERDAVLQTKQKEEQDCRALRDVRSTLSRCEHTSPQTPEAIRKRFKEPVTLDAETAYARLTLSEAGRRVTSTWREQTPPDHPKRFTNWRSVLGTEGFTSGRHYWELEMLQDGGWHLGVAHESVSRKEKFKHCPESGLWVVQWYNNKYVALTTHPHTLSPSRPPPKLGVYLDYKGGQVSLYNADSMELLYTFTGAAFSGRVYPYFNLYSETDLRLV